ncbi:MAG: histidine kinase dimerization/phospho-acceptor domain-containing protein, partial [Bryobacteraceae bacterium]
MKASKTVDLAALCRPVAEASLVAMAALEGADHIVRYVNPAFCVLTGKTEEGLLGLAFSGAVPGGEGFLALLDRVYGTGFPENHTESETSTSQTSCWACATWPIRAADNLIIGVMIQVTETTAFHQRTRAVNEALMIGSVRQHEMTEAADRLNEQLRWANEDLRQFAFAASHDLQEPLRMITTYSQLLVRGYLDRLGGEAAVCVDVITKGTQQMRDLLAGLLSYTEAGS